MKRLTLCATLLYSTASTQAAIILFEDEFSSTNAQGWVRSGQTNVSATGNYAGSSGINTSGLNDHSDIHFDADGNEIATANLHFAAMGNGNNSTGNTISQTLSLTAGQTYEVYFRYAGSHNPGHQFTVTFTLGGDSATTGTVSAADETWTSGNFSFTPSTSGNATLTFLDTATPVNSDLLLDSVVVAFEPLPVPEPSSLAILAIGGFGLLLRRNRS